MINPSAFTVPSLFLNAIYHYVFLPALFYTENLLLGKARQAIFDQENLIKNELTPAAQKSENGVEIVRVGPPMLFSTRHLAVVVPKSKSMLKELLDEGIENDPSGRTIMNPFQSLLGGPSITNTTGALAMLQLRKMRKFTGDVHGFKIIERDKFKAAMESWHARKDGFILLDEIKLLTRRVTYNRYITPEKEFSSEENEQVNAGFSGLKKSLLAPYSLPTQLHFYSVAKQYREDSGRFIDSHIDEVSDGLTQKGFNILSDLISDEIQDTSSIDEIKKTMKEKLNGSMLLMGSMDGFYINLVGILFQIMKNPDIADKLRRELDAVSVKMGDTLMIDNDHLMDPSKLPYLTCIIHEGLRFISSAPILPRYTQSGIQTEHINIPAHSTILVNLEAMHHDETLWGKDVNEFKPERFLEKDAPKLNDFPFMPFSTGTRQCPGVKVGLMSLKLFISELYLNYDLVPAAGQPEPTVDKTAALVMDIGPGYKVYLHSRHDNCESAVKVGMHKIK